MKKTKPITILCILFVFHFGLNAQISYNALPWRMSTAYNNYLLRDVHQQYADRKIEIEKAFASKEKMIAYRDDCIQRYKKIMGGLPEKGNLNARFTGSSAYEGFRIEKIIFESLPHRYVTANLYIPDGEGPFPAALQLCGHGLGGKIPASNSALLFAQNGIAVLVVDPIGQGERIQFIDDESNTLTRGATTEHTLLNAGANLLGTSLAALEFWDNHRAIDYLVSREDIDKNNIGAYGSSGGGTQTSYLIGLDERIKVASVCSYFTQREKVLEVYGPSDGCQHIPYEGKEHLEIADFVLMMGPKPVLILSGKYDFVDYWGATQAFKELKKGYTALGSPEKVSMFSVENGHGMPKPKREALVTWFKKWMLNDDTPVVETELFHIPEEDLQCTGTGQVNSAIADNISVPDYFLDEAKTTEEQRIEFLKNDLKTITGKVNEILCIGNELEEIFPEQTGEIKMRTYDIQKYQIIRPEQMPLPCVLVLPGNITPESQITIFLNEGGKDEILSDARTMESYANQGEILIVADLRGYGETSDPLSLNDTKYWNREYRNAMISKHIGKPIVGQRVIDVKTILDFVDTESILKGRIVKIKANGTYGPVAVHATFLDERISKTEITGSIKSYTEFLKNPMQRNVYSNVLYGVLQYYDLKDLIEISGKNRIRFLD
ncbi:alpha/beta hydrolase family protein [Maribellus comscasis]|nr:acetylxylan esterase [Maribellus comscasis]